MCALPSIAYSAPADEKSLSDRISELLVSGTGKQDSGNIRLHLRILTPASQLKSLCPVPELRLPGHSSRLAGIHSIIARCRKRQLFIQTFVSATGTYWIAAHSLSPGQLIGASDIRPATGMLDRLPGDVIMDPAQITGRVTSRRVYQGQPFSAGQLHQQHVIRAGSEVEILATGSGFLIRSTGKALDNAAFQEEVRVKTRNGQLLRGRAVGENKVEIDLHG